MAIVDFDAFAPEFRPQVAFAFHIYGLQVLMLWRAQLGFPEGG